MEQREWTAMLSMLAVVYEARRATGRRSYGSRARFRIELTNAAGV